jgi:hypothetical protein
VLFNEKKKTITCEGQQLEEVHHHVNEDANHQVEL